MQQKSRHIVGSFCLFLQKPQRRIMTIEENTIPKGVFKVEVFSGDDQSQPPLEVYEFENSTTNAGGAILLDLMIGAGGTVFSNANAYLGVGDSTTAFAAAQTDLQASTNKLRVAMDATYPSRSSQVLTFKSTFSTGQANYAWEEAGIFNHASAGTMYCRAVSTIFTKTSAVSAVLTYQVTIP
jgi:hypothetical protein